MVPSHDLYPIDNTKNLQLFVAFACGNTNTLPISLMNLIKGAIKMHAYNLFLPKRDIPISTKHDSPMLGIKGHRAFY